MVNLPKNLFPDEIRLYLGTTCHRNSSLNGNLLLKYTSTLFHDWLPIWY